MSYLKVLDAQPEEMKKEDLLSSVTQDNIEKGHLAQMDAMNREATYFNGASGIGKTLFCDMFLGQLNKKEYKELLAEKLFKKVTRNVLNNATDDFVVKCNQLNSKLNISVTDSPGYGDKTDIKEWRDKILNHIKMQFQNHKDAL
jgi:septin family protein